MVGNITYICQPPFILAPRQHLRDAVTVLTSSRNLRPLRQFFCHLYEIQQLINHAEEVVSLEITPREHICQTLEIFRISTGLWRRHGWRRWR